MTNPRERPDHEYRDDDDGRDAGADNDMGGDADSTGSSWSRAIDRMAGTTVHRSRTNKMLGGVCGGLAEATGVSANGLRLGFAFMAGFATPVGLVAYCGLWLVLPDSEHPD
ncbi:PspC domain-containing protein [uncultured Corynebacterium sp.]|uniref:PspC domain-containing protein n=1 Tax=uncultured Corynebacterium sp. TaxID=159447 RepID=UPI0025EB42C7|nr:PspC domain-containing protein [uncultured Corynebacterium sp.]